MMDAFGAAYAMSAGVLIVCAMALALNQEIKTGIVGSLALGAIVVCQLVGLERFGEVPNWRALLTISEAVLAMWAAYRWAQRKDAHGPE